MKNKMLINLASIVFAGSVTVAVSAPPDWSYEEEPYWGALEDATQPVPLSYPYAECNLGKHQSPVDLADEKIVKSRSLNRLAVQYGTDMPSFINTGHAIQVNISQNFRGGLKVGKELLPLTQLHFHEPSEHVFGNKKFPAELHFVHVSRDGKIAVLAVMINIGKENTVFQTILDNMPYRSGEENSTARVWLKLKKLLPSGVSTNNLKYLTLAGSLTTPPCSEGVQWYILKESITISEAQLEYMKTFYSNNARSTQDLNERSILSN
ncbi:carbonic anhydrase [Nitrosomonas stercoris]|uniref:carbonic anhydrase n=1 Tax=Nitrosomonas stercoris TaxID=1444684 RepID=A0A4Y1YKF6_9PROT|nr:carbonic anhydrase [Nitrosomonas stercoris]